MIKGNAPTLNEIDSIFEKNFPTKSGIWVVEKDRDKILNYLNNNDNLNCKYKINEGCLEISDDENASSLDKKIRKVIDSNKQIIIDISSVYYMVDTVTGNIVDNPYNELSKSQTYEYVQDKNKMIIFITENSEEILTENDIFDSIINLLNPID